MSGILVTGGAGYIGSHIVRQLLEGGHEVRVIDDLSEGHRESVGEASLTVADFADTAALSSLLGDGSVEFIFHMAAYCEVGASVADPAAYYENNVTRSLALLEAARRHGVHGIVFSSTAATYGEPLESPIDEEHPQLPTNPYGETKLAIERALAWYQRAYGLRHVCLRYFNAAGAHPDGSIGEDHAEESHLIPRLLLGLIEGGDPIPIFGDDYPTPDGTCVRDYVHVVDLAQAHVLAMQAMKSGAVKAAAFNLGNGEGFSVLDVVRAIGQVTGQMPETRRAERRPGDPARLVASSARIFRELGWRPAFPELEQIVRTAWEWHRNHPRGYDDRPVERGPDRD
jgi:UDP-glucose 4-epimerase